MYDSTLFTDIYIERDNGVCDRMSITKVKNSSENWCTLYLTSFLEREKNIRYTPWSIKKDRGKTNSSPNYNLTKFSCGFVCCWRIPREKK